MSKITKKVRKVETTVKIFVLCFVVYFIGNIHMK